MFYCILFINKKISINFNKLLQIMLGAKEFNLLSEIQQFFFGSFDFLNCVLRFPMNLLTCDTKRSIGYIPFLCALPIILFASIFLLFTSITIFYSILSFTLKYIFLVLMETNIFISVKFLDDSSHNCSNLLEFIVLDTTFMFCV